ncbi:hypothetical protein BGZ65_004874 [Modicella reniformis]|uniref:Uncharacterized protein n=1 Tax=Modicella reniformis TaxID=1440133 RepID=A0A9P6ML21_9FUNG|nr:hypothetical protein BGZ65_004874 [Modicella reniformis]
MAQQSYETSYQMSHLNEQWNILEGVTVPKVEEARMVRSNAGSDCKIELVESAIGEGTGSSLSKIDVAKCDGAPMSEEKDVIESSKISDCRWWYSASDAPANDDDDNDAAAAAAADDDNGIDDVDGSPDSTVVFDLAVFDINWGFVEERADNEVAAGTEPVDARSERLAKEAEVRCCNEVEAKLDKEDEFVVEFDAAGRSGVPAD